jgi:hypothetical protein
VFVRQAWGPARKARVIKVMFKNVEVEYLEPMRLFNGKLKYTTVRSHYTLSRIEENENK